MTEITLDIRGFSVRIATGCPEILSRLGDIAVRHPSGEPAGEILFRITRAGDGYRAALDGGDTLDVPDDVTAVLLVHEWIDRCIISRTPDTLWLHAGSFTLGGHGFIVPGEKGAGKTTLLCALALAGVPVHGDEYVSVRDGNALPYPRKFHLKERTLETVPALRPVYERLIEYPAFGGGGFVFFDPGTVGRPWKMAGLVRPVVVYVEPDHAAGTLLRPASVPEMFERVLPQVVSCHADTGRAARELYSFLSSAGRFVLTLGDPEGAAALFRAHIPE